MRMIERQLQTAVNNIVKWCDSNGHSISASKSCCVHFCRKRGIHPDPEIRIRAVQIPVVPDVRFLGVIFDRRLPLRGLTSFRGSLSGEYGRPRPRGTRVNFEKTLTG
ncbi:RNase H domain-containing protein [Trichonephila clavipes]|nr:RNase H domain-containing protein [Trichonephila clavipes]